jgi:hypothetical protein
VHPPPIPHSQSRSGWAREDENAAADDLWGGEGDYYETAAETTQSHSQSQPDNGGSGRRTFLTRALEMAGGGGNGSGSGSGVGEGEGAKDSKGKGKSSKHGRKRSDRNSGGNRHYAEIEIGRGSDIW